MMIRFYRAQQLCAAILLGVIGGSCASTRQLPQVHVGSRKLQVSSFKEAGEKANGPVVNFDFRYDGELTAESSQVELSKKEKRFGYFDMFTLPEGTRSKKRLRLCTVPRSSLMGLGPRYAPAVSFILLGMNGEAFLDKKKKVIGKGVWRSGAETCHSYAIPQIDKPIKLMIYSDSQYHQGSGHLIVSGFDLAVTGSEVGRYAFSFDEE